MARRRTSILSVSSAYKAAMFMHNAIPYYCFPDGRALPPWHYFFEVTRRCNLRCRMCQYREWYDRYSAKEQKEGELSTDEWKDLVDQTTPRSLITFTGGEVWARRDFPEILEHASKKRYTHFITNGLLLNDDKLQALVDLAPRNLWDTGFCFMGTSIDGTREVHNEIRGRDFAFDKTLDNIRKIKELRKGRRFPMVHVTSVIQPDNIDVLPDLTRLVAEAGASVYNLTIEVRFLSIENLGEFDPATIKTEGLEPSQISPTKLSAALDKVRKAASESGIELRLPVMTRDQLLKYHDGGIDLENFACRGIWTNLYIGSKGNAFPCFIYKLGSVRDQRLSELWNGDRMRAFRRRIRKGVLPVCAGCCHLEQKSLREPAPEVVLENEESRG
jgi:MoaA/NifB/PqqE/SkfB family radical SAM enzyme